MSPKKSGKKAEAAPAEAQPSGLRRVVITGAGTINALGHDVPTTLAAFREGRCGIGPLEFRDVDRLTVKIGRSGAGVPAGGEGFDPAALI